MESKKALNILLVKWPNWNFEVLTYSQENKKG